jgi:orotidine-5'-phosphate decarboxylase
MITEEMILQKIIVALDMDRFNEVTGLIQTLQGRLKYVKVGMQLYYAQGPQVIDYCLEKGLKVFLDLKIHDIPNTVYHAAASIARTGVHMVNVHASGGLAMLKSAKKGVEEVQSGVRPLLLGVTQLTSTSKAVLNNELKVQGDVPEHVIHLARMANAAGLDGVICSGLEVKKLRDLFGRDFLLVTPGVRLNRTTWDDQVRVVTPAEAIKNGADYIVVGREITKSDDQLKVFDQIADSIHDVVTEGETGSPSVEIAKALLRIGVFVFRPQKPFTWVSGIKSPVYCDNRLILSYPDVRDRIIRCFVKGIKVHFPEVDVIAGVATAGIPHAALIAKELGLPMIYVRQQAKEHGKENKIEGYFRRGHKIVVIEDHISTGKSAIEAASALKEAGGHVLGVYSVFSYGLKQSAHHFTEAQIPFFSLTRLEDLLTIALDNGYLGAQDRDAINKWRTNLTL